MRNKVTGSGQRDSAPRINGNAVSNMQAASKRQREEDRSDNQPTGRAVKVPYTSAAATMKPGASDGINTPAQGTRATHAGGQYDRS